MAAAHYQDVRWKGYLLMTIHPQGSIQASCLLYVKYKEGEYSECLHNKFRETQCSFPWNGHGGMNGLGMASIVSHL